MFTTSDLLHRRIVSRYLGSQRPDRNSQGRQAFVWHLPAPEPYIPDGLVLQCSSGCTLTTMEVEQMLPARMNVWPGSCRIVPVHADAKANKTRFAVLTKDGKRVTGTITVSIVATDRKLDAFSVVDLDA